MNKLGSNSYVGTLTVSRYTLFNLLKQSIISGFKTQVKTVKTGCAHGFKIVKGSLWPSPVPQS